MPNTMDRIIEFFFPLYGAQRRRARALLAFASNAESKGRRTISCGLELSEPQYLDISTLTTAHFTNCDKPSHQQTIRHTTTPEHSNPEPIIPLNREKRRYSNPNRLMATTYSTLRFVRIEEKKEGGFIQAGFNIRP